MGTQEKHISVDTINANPSILNDQQIMQGELRGLLIKNIVIRNLILQDISAPEAHFENITFENCRFIKTKIVDSKFINVAFKNCQIIPFNNSTHHTDVSSFDGASFNNVIFDNTDFKYVDFGGIDGNNGFILFKNIQQAIPNAPAPFISVSNAEIRVLDSQINGVIAGRENVNAITKNSTYASDAGIYCDTNFIENSKMQQANIGTFKILVLKDSVFGGNIRIMDGKGYFLNNSYLSEPLELRTVGTITVGPGLHAGANGAFYILAKDNTPCPFRIFGGTVTLKGFTLENSIIGSLREKDPPITALNLQNVTIKGGDWGSLRLAGGKWENVRIEPSILVNKTFVKNVYAHRLDFPKGPPWQKEGEFVFSVTESPSPFEWEKVKVPTPEEMGLAWWPAVEPGYRPEK